MLSHLVKLKHEPALVPLRNVALCLSSFYYNQDEGS